jgi:hypothetical protein
MIAEALKDPVFWARNLPARTALKICNQSHIRSVLGQRYDKDLQDHSRKLPKLGELETSIVEAVKRDGIFITSIDQLALPGTEEIFQAGAMLAQAFEEKARALAAEGETFIIVPPEEIVRHPDIFHWGLQDRLLDIAESYIGLPPAYDGVVLNYTVADGREISTRKWHRDWEDRRMLKVAIYLNDVDGDGGPFQLIRRHDSQQKDTEGFYYGLADDQELEQRFGKTFAQDIVSCEGPAGTVIFMDPARFYHRGKPATARDRAAFFYSYFARNPRHPFLCERTGMKRSDVARLSKGLPQRQLDTALWRQQLAPALRLVPPATI